MLSRILYRAIARLHRWLGSVLASWPNRVHRLDPVTASAYAASLPYRPGGPPIEALRLRDVGKGNYQKPPAANLRPRRPARLPPPPRMS